MEFLHEVLSAAGADMLYAVTIVPDFGCYFRGVKGVNEYSEQKILLTVGKMTVAVTGEGLCVGRFYEGDLFVSGRVRGVTIE